MLIGRCWAVTATQLKDIQQANIQLVEYYKKRPDLVKSDITCIWIAYHTSDPDLIIDLYGVTYPIIYQVAYNLSPLLADDLTSEVYLFFMARRVGLIISPFLLCFSSMRLLLGMNQCQKKGVTYKKSYYLISYIAKV